MERYVLTVREEELVFLSLVSAFEANNIFLTEEQHHELAIVANQSLDDMHFQILNVLKMYGYKYKEQACKMTWKIFQIFIEKFCRSVELDESIKISIYTKNLSHFHLKQIRQAIIEFHEDPREFQSYYGYIDFTCIKSKAS